MISIKIEGLELVAGLSTRFDRQVRFAASRTINTLAQQHVIPAIRAEMTDSFDRPTPYTLRSVRQYGLATRDRLETFVGFKSAEGTSGTDPAKYLRWQIEGGQRRMKRFEVALRSRGILPGGYFTVAGDAAKLDAYGNVSAGQIVQILSYFQAFDEAGKGFKINATKQTIARRAKGTRNRLGEAYFVGRPADGKLPPGIYRRVKVFGFGSALKPVLIFVQSARYEKRLDYAYAAQKAAERRAAVVFAAELVLATATAR